MIFLSIPRVRNAKYESLHEQKLFFYRIFIQLIVYITQNILNLTCLI